MSFIITVPVASVAGDTKFCPNVSKAFVHSGDGIPQSCYCSRAPRVPHTYRGLSQELRRRQSSTPSKESLLNLDCTYPAELNVSRPIRDIRRVSRGSTCIKFVAEHNERTASCSYRLKTGEQTASDLGVVRKTRKTTRDFTKR